MENFSKKNKLITFHEKNKTLTEIIGEIETFNIEYWLIEPTTHRVNFILDNEFWYDKILNNQREWLSEKILNSDIVLKKIWLEIFTYRGQEFYDDNVIGAFGSKIGLKIINVDVLKEYLSLEDSTQVQKLYTFLYNEIIDSLHMSMFYWDNVDEKNSYISDLLSQLSQIENINHSWLTFLIKDLETWNLYNSLLLKYFMEKYKHMFFPDYIWDIQDFDFLNTIWADAIWALSDLDMKKGYWKNSIKKINLWFPQESEWDYLEKLAVFLSESLHHTKKLIWDVKVFLEMELKQKHSLDLNPDYKIFIHDFEWEFENNKYFLSEILEDFKQKKDEK